MTHMWIGLACLTVALLAVAAVAVDWLLGDREQPQAGGEEYTTARLRVDAVLAMGVTGQQWDEFVAHHPLIHRIGDAP